MPAHGEFAPRRPDSGARRRPREPSSNHQQPHHQQYPSQQRPHAAPTNPRQYQQPVPRKRRDTTDSNTLSASAQSTQAKRPRVRFMPPLDAPLLSQVATMSGFLTKQADNEPGKWTKYYFVLKPTTYLYYYTSEHDAEPRGIIDTEFLRDVRFNTECVQRSVGGSAHGFRITGQLPPPLCPDGKDPNKTQFRPVYLDAETSDQAEAWMDAIRHHRFDLERHRDYDDLLDSMDEVEDQLTTLTAQTKEIANVSRQVLHRGKELVCALRGVDLEDDNGRPRGMSQDEDLLATMQSIGLLFDEMFSEADRQRRLAELLRQREDATTHHSTQLKECEAELKIQMVRSERLEQELALMREEAQIQKEGYDTRYSELVARERQLLAREKELLVQMKEREKLCDQRLQEVDLKSSKWTKELEKEATRRNAELEKRRKALEKQQKQLDQKQALLDKRLQETAPSKMRFVGAIGKSRTAKDEMLDEQPEHDHESEATAWAGRPKRRFARPGFLSRKNTITHDHDHDHDDMEDEVMASQAEIESDYFDSQADISLSNRQRPQLSIDRSSDASTTRLSGVSYSSSISKEYTTRTGRSHTTTTASMPTPQGRSAPARSASVPVTASTSGAGRAATTRLPPEWTYKESKKFQGRLYYYNRITGETRWEFPYDAVLENESSSQYGVPRESGRSSVDDGNDFVTHHDEVEKEDISSFLHRTRANTYRPPATTGAASTRSRSVAEPLKSWEAKYYSDAAMASRMGAAEETDGMHTIEEEETATANSKAKAWGRTFPKLRAKGCEDNVGYASTKSIVRNPVEEGTSKPNKGWKLMPKVPFGKGSRTKASAAPPPPESPRDTDPIVHDDGRCEF